MISFFIDIMWKIVKLGIAIIIAQLAGAIGGIFTSMTVSTWFVDLVKPSFNPPSWLFGPVWTTLFLLMGISLYLAYDNKWDKWAKGFFVAQYVLNILWSVLFFGLKSPGLAFIEIIVLWGAILGMIISFYRINKWAGLINIPYLLWVSFAAVLNFFIYFLN